MLKQSPSLSTLNLIASSCFLSKPLWNDCCWKRVQFCVLLSIVLGKQKKLVSNFIPSLWFFQVMHSQKQKAYLIWNLALLVNFTKQFDCLRIRFIVWSNDDMNVYLWQKILFQEKKIQKLNELVRDLRRQLLQCRNENQVELTELETELDQLLVTGV